MVSEWGWLLTAQNSMVSQTDPRWKDFNVRKLHRQLNQCPPNSHDYKRPDLYWSDQQSIQIHYMKLNEDIVARLDLLIRHCHVKSTNSFCRIATSIWERCQFSMRKLYDWWMTCLLRLALRTQSPASTLSFSFAWNVESCSMAESIKAGEEVVQKCCLLSREPRLCHLPTWSSKLANTILYDIIWRRQVVGYWFIRHFMWLDQHQGSMLAKYRSSS